MTNSRADFWRMYKEWLIEERKRLNAQINSVNFRIGVEREKEELANWKNRQEQAAMGNPGKDKECQTS